MRNLRSALLMVALVSVTLGARAQSVVNSVHNLSAGGPGSVKALSETEICIFCHTPHSKSPHTPLWNRDDPGSFFLLYSSSSSESVPGQPDGSSLLCLSCHDGTIAMGNVLTRVEDISFASGISVMPYGRSNLTTDLSDDHPVSFIYNTTLASTDGELNDPSEIAMPVTLPDGKVQCTSCHNPHNDTYYPFLTLPYQISELCYACHDRDYWSTSGHSGSTATWNGTGTDPWPSSDYTTVAENGCSNCHASHNAAGRERLLFYLNEEDNCLKCHNGNVAQSDIAAEMVKPYIHNIYAYTLVHDVSEDPLVDELHVECTDCHNPHATTNGNATAPFVSGSLTGVMGIDLSGAPVTPAMYQYEVCFRCHADTPSRPPSSTPRQIIQSNTRLEFNPANPSYHPVAAPGTNPDSPSLIAPDYSESSIIYCTDCHAGDGGGSSEGPHGSIYPQILKMRYETADFTTESSVAYELCYSCHDRNSILGDNSFSRHKSHITDYRTPCNACHDPHGISNSQGSFTGNSHLINFDTDIVGPDNNGRFRFEDLGDFTGRCFLRCHGRNHPGWSY